MSELFVACVRFDPADSPDLLENLLDEMPVMFFDVCRQTGAAPIEEPALTVTYHDELGPCLAAVALANRVEPA